MVRKYASLSTLLTTSFVLVFSLLMGFGDHCLAVQAEDWATGLVINEIDYDQPSTDAAEFIEIKNTDASSVNLDPYRLDLINGTGGGATVYESIGLLWQGALSIKPLSS